MAEMRFEEKILYKTHQHWIIPLLKSFKMIGSAGIIVAFITYFLSSFSWIWTLSVFLILSFFIATYYYYLWIHSWLMIGNQKITLTVRNGIFSQYAMSIRYRNIRDCAVSKSNFWSFLLKYGTLFIRSSGAEWDFESHFIPKVGKLYALVNALSRYGDDDRSEIHTIEILHNHHKKSEFTNIDHTIEKHG